MLERWTLRSRHPTVAVNVTVWCEPTTGRHAIRDPEREVGVDQKRRRLGRQRTGVVREVLGAVGMIGVKVPNRLSGGMNPFADRRHRGAGFAVSGATRRWGMEKLGRPERDQCGRGAESLTDAGPVEPGLRVGPLRGGRVKWSRVGLREQGLCGLGYRSVDLLEGLRKGGRAGLDAGAWTSRRVGWRTVCV